MYNRDRPADDSGSGTLLGLALAGIVASLVVCLVPVGAGLGIRESVAAAADASALAAADVVSGAAPGYPCEVARRVAAANRSTLAACTVDGLVVTVRARATFFGLSMTSTATAGPPRVVTN
jgi:secretion/DNA translocation related TadE-like protein